MVVHCADLVRLVVVGVPRFMIVVGVPRFLSVVGVPMILIAVGAPRFLIDVSVPRFLIRIGVPRFLIVKGVLRRSMHTAPTKSTSELPILATRPTRAATRPQPKTQNPEP